MKVEGVGLLLRILSKLRRPPVIEDSDPT